MGWVGYFLYTNPPLEELRLIFCLCTHLEANSLTTQPLIKATQRELKMQQKSSFYSYSFILSRGKAHVCAQERKVCWDVNIFWRQVLHLRLEELPHFKATLTNQSSSKKGF